MKVTFKTGSEANYGSTNGELFFASNTKQIMLNGIKYIPKKLSELTNDSGFISSITKSMVEGVLTGNITSHTHSYIPLADKGLSDGMVPYYVDFPSFSQLVSLGYNEESTSIENEYYFKGLCKWAIDNYANNGHIILIGNAQPNSVGYCCIQLYSDSGKDKDTGLPNYCSGVYNGLNGTLVNFRCNKYAWYWKGSFGGNAETSSKWANARTITLTGSVTGSVSIDGSANVSLDTTTNHTHSEYLPLSGGTLNGALTLPTLTSTGGIVLGVESINGSLGIKKYNEGFIGFSDILGGINDSVPFEGISLGWGSSPETSANSVRINASTFTYKGNSVLHSGNLGYTSSGLSRAVQKDASGNLFIVAPSLFEQGISNNYPKNLRWSNETEGQLVYDTEETAGNTTIVEVSIPVANGTSKGFLKSTSTVTNVTGYTPCPVVSGTPYYKEDCLYLGSTEIGYTGIMEYGIQYTYNYGTKLPYLEDYTPDSIPRCVVLCFPDRSSNYRFLFWLSAFDEGDPYIARFYNSAYETWLTIDTASRQIILSYGDTWQS